MAVRSQPVGWNFPFVDPRTGYLTPVAIRSLQDSFVLLQGPGGALDALTAQSNGAFASILAEQEALHRSLAAQATQIAEQAERVQALCSDVAALIDGQTVAIEETRSEVATLRDAVAGLNDRPTSEVVADQNLEMRAEMDALRDEVSALVSSLAPNAPRESIVWVDRARILSGSGTPEAAVYGSIGDVFLRRDGGALTTLYVKESGTATNTGWVGK